MKTELNFLELGFLVQELQSCVGSRVDRVYEPDGFLFQLHKSGAGKLFLRITGKVLWLSKGKLLPSESVSGFCSLLRARLEGKKLTQVEQLGSERIVSFTFQTQADSYYLIVELFSKGNVVLTDSNKKVLAATEERSWKDREIRRGVQYVPPPAKENLSELKPENIVPDEKLLAKLGFGKLLAHEIIVRGGDFNAYQSLLKEKPAPRAYPDGELSPIKLVQYKESGESFPSFSELIDSRLSQSMQQQREARVKQSFESKRAKIQEVIDMQTRTIESLENQAAECQLKGELIYEHYQELKDILEELNKAKAKFSLQEMKAKLKGHAKIKDLNPKTSDVIIEL